MEQQNDHKIILLKQGSFVRAFEHSAYLFTKLIKEFKLIKKAPKVLNGETLIYLGFQLKDLPSVMAGWRCVYNSSERMDYEADRTYEHADYQRWKERIPLFGITAPLEETETLIPQQEASPLKEDQTDMERRVAKEIRTFDMLNKTPFECMMFLDSLKAMLSGN